MSFQIAAEMPYANNESIREKARILFEKLIEYLKAIDHRDVACNAPTIYVPDVHGDFVHLMITLYKHGVLENNLDLKKKFKYVFLGDFYDRAPDSDVIDFWLNNQIKNKVEIYRLIGNHELAFFERDANDYPVIFPSQDSIKDISNNFQITGNILKKIADGKILAAYVDGNTLYVHSYIINDDFTQLGLDKNTDILDFANALNEKLKQHGQYAYDLFCENKKDRKYDWKAIMGSFNEDPLFNIYKKKNDISTSFIWRRTGSPILNIFPTELEIDIPDNVYQIVGHTPVFLFDLPRNQSINKPFVISVKNGTGKVQFSDVGIGYYYRNDFERPEVAIEKLPYN
ncbi:MAG: metallophosphoesterase [Candidatus Melainabacteria bacterium]|nr:metallophosphoesterase [Candidatus Melainabacteria bacterium]